MTDLTDPVNVIASRSVDSLRVEGKADNIDMVIARTVCNIPMSRLGELSGPTVRAALAAVGLRIVPEEE